jgi:hypothetical protein
LTEEEQQKLAAIEQASRSGKKLSDADIAFLKKVFEAEVAVNDIQSGKASQTRH